jgi:hypothetical protein
MDANDAVEDHNEKQRNKNIFEFRETSKVGLQLIFEEWDFLNELQVPEQPDDSANEYHSEFRFIACLLLIFEDYPSGNE